ncbi:hypothetical protein [Filimonas effusa]|uniref:Uncharacterized protein n=1 Tax=Filimonas effusa TaxID=2508721 RepID=A0A4Q1D4Q0_9BACT|nr:hypothetical protein [Filimonas effusa]RXK83318.1 hypothetical protein ESB13_14525 [Filimonas effusa]
MKLFDIKQMSLVAGFGLLLTSCAKEAPNIFNMFNVTLDLQMDKTPGEDGLIEISATDSVTVNYTIECPGEEMYGIALFKAGQSGGTVTNIQPTKKATGTYKFYGKDMGVGYTTYRIWAVNRASVYLGDGYKEIRIKVKSEFSYFTNRSIYIADTAGKAYSFISFTTARTFSYLDGAAKSDSVDMGFYMTRKDTLVKFNGVDSTVTYYPLIVYPIAANPNPNKLYDFSKWTKRATVFSAPEDGSEEKLRVNFNTVDKIITEAKKKTFIPFIQTAYDKRAEGDRNNMFTSKFVFFRNHEGKYGVILFNVAKKDSEGRTYINLSWKMQP